MEPMSLLPGFNSNFLLVLSLVGTFVFGVSGGMAGLRANLDLFGVVVIAVVVAMAGGTIRDVLIGIPPATFRDWRYLAVAGGAGLITTIAHPAVDRIQPLIDALDGAGLALFCVTGAATALAHRLGVAQSIILGAVTGIGGGMLRDVLLPVLWVEGWVGNTFIWRGNDMSVAKVDAHGRTSESSRQLATPKVII